MKKNLLISILAGALFLMGSGFTYATPFESTQNYGSGAGIAVNDENVNNYYSAPLSQTVYFVPPLDGFDSAVLTIGYSGIHTNTTSELWYAFGSDTSGTPSAFTELGPLVGHGDVTATQDFDLSAFEPTVPGGGLSQWTLYFAFRETTNGHDAFTLYSTRVAGAYTAHLTGATDPNDPPAVPEPTTMLLLGTGLAGLAGFGRRLKK